MKKIVCAVLAAVLIISLAGCSSKNQTASDNPLSDKQYEPLVIDEGIDFLSFFNSLNKEYAQLISDFADYLQLHSAEVEDKNKGLADFRDYEKTLDPYYEFLYKIMHSDSTNIPEEYSDVWTYYKALMEKNKADLDGLYPLKGQQLTDALANMFTYIQASETIISEELSTHSIKIGDTISLDFVEMSFDETGVADTILPVDTSGVYSYIGDKENEKYFYLTGTLKNTSGNAYSADNIYAQMIFDGKYTYSAILAACDGSNDFYGDRVNPLASVKYYIYASIPDELIESYSKCVIIFGFTDDFSTSKYSITRDKCDYMYTLTQSRDS